MKNTKTAKETTARKHRSKSRLKQKFPPGWDERRVREVIAHYDNLTDEALAREIEEAAEATGQTMVAVPTELVPAVLKLIARHQKSA